MESLRELAGRLAGLSGEVASIRRALATPQLPYSSLDDASVPEKDAEGNVVSRWGKQPDGTHGVVVYDGPTPPTPTAPLAEGGAASVTATWDGTYDGDVGRLDFHLIEVYAAPEPFEYIEDATLVGAIPDPDGGAVTFARPVGTWHVGLVALSQAGKRSAVSLLAQAEATSVVDQAIVDELNDRLDGLGDDLRTLYDETLPDLHSRLDTLSDETLPGLADRLADAEEVLGPLPGRLEEAEAAAAAAQGAADDAAGAAAAAQSEAEAAAQAALDAAGIAEGKGEVIVQISAPTGSRAKAENLWVRLPDHKVHIYDTEQGKWVAATDPDLIAAAGEAAQAKQDAADAAQAAQNAADRAEAAHDRAEALEGQVGTLQADLDAAEAALATVRDETLPALAGDIETLRDDTIPALQDIVGPLPDAVAAAQSAADAAQGRADAAHDDLADLAGEVAGKSALHYGDDAPEDTNALWIKNGVPHVYVDHGEDAADWLNQDTGLANWRLVAASGGSAEYSDGIIVLKGYGSRAESPIIPIEGTDPIRVAALVKAFGRAPGREEEQDARVLFGYYWYDENGEPTTTTPTQSASALYVTEGEWDRQTRNLNYNDHVRGFRLRVSLSDQWTGEEVHIAASDIWQGPLRPTFDGDSPGFKWDGERWASTSSYAGPGWFPVNDPEVREAAARAQSARDRAEEANERAASLEESVGTLQTDLADAAGAIDTLRDETLPGLAGRLEDVEYDTRNFAAEWITAGTLDTARLNAQEVAGAVGTFIRINADQITAGLIQGSQVEAESVAGAIGSFLRLNAEQITAGTIGTERLDAQEVAGAVGTFLDLDAGQITSGKISTARLDAEEVAGAVGTFLALDAGQITSGKINTARLDAEEVGAAVGAFVTLSAEQITTGELGADRIAVNELFADMFAANKITTLELDAAQITGDAAFIADLTAAVVTADVFEGRSFIGGTFTGTTFRTAASGQRVQISSAGFQAWNSSGEQTVSITGADGNYLAGEFSTSPPGEPGLQIRNLSTTGGLPILLFSEDGSSSSDHAAIWIDSSWLLNMRGKRGAGGRGPVNIHGGLAVTDGGVGDYDGAWMIYTNGGTNFADVHASEVITPQIGIFGDAKIYFENIGGGRIRQPTVRSTTTTASPNVYVAQNGTLAYSTSTARHKVAIEQAPVEWSRRLLNVNPATWFDRGDAERYAQYLTRMDTFGPAPNPDDLTAVLEPLRRIPGLVAEDVEAAGLEAYVNYEDDPERPGERRPIGLAYDRLWTLLIPLVRDQEERIAALEARLEGAPA